MKEISVDWHELELAFREISETENYFDTENGGVLSLLPGFQDADEMQGLLSSQPQRYKLIEALTTDFSRDVMVRFLSNVSSKQVRAELEMALKGPAGVTRYWALLKRDGGLLSQFHRFEQESFWTHVRMFLSCCGVNPVNRAPEPELFHDVA